MFNVTIVGAGLSGSEAALVLSQFQNISINLIEMRPNVATEVHKSEYCAELVCSNSFKSLKFNTAAGMLKYELASLASPVFDIALKNTVSAGNALAVDRTLFSKSVTDLIKKSKNINYITDEFFDIDKCLKDCDVLLIASGPLTSQKLASKIKDLTNNDDLYFYDAAAPIVMADSIDMSKVFCKDRYSDSQDGDYLNCPFTKSEYENFINELLNAKCVIKKDFESKDLFQACQPIEEIARCGFDAPRHGNMKPVGLRDSQDKRPYAVVQLRPENANKTAYNLVGFQTNLIFSEQQRVFRMIPGLQDAEFARYGVMHKNIFINAPKLLNKNLQYAHNEKIYFAGQLSGTEGYLEAVRSGHHAAISIACNLLNKENVTLPTETAFGALLDYATNEKTKKYQPMHVNFGLLPPLEKNIKNKKERYTMFAVRGNIFFDEYIDKLITNGLVDKDRSQDLKNKIEKLWIKN